MRALRGHLDDVHLRADIVEVADLRMHDLDVDVERVRFRLLGSPQDIDIERAEASVRIEQRELDRLLADLGIPATTTVTRDGISLQLPQRSTSSLRSLCAKAPRSSASQG